MAADTRSEGARSEILRVDAQEDSGDRRAYLCTLDRHALPTGRDPNDWVEQQLGELVELFAVELCDWSLADRHVHLVLRARADVAADFSAAEVARRWRLLDGRDGSRQSPPQEDSEPHWDREPADLPSIARWRRHLASASWFVRHLSSRIGGVAGRVGDAERLQPVADAPRPQPAHHGRLPQPPHGSRQAAPLVGRFPLVEPRPNAGAIGAARRAGPVSTVAGSERPVGAVGSGVAALGHLARPDRDRKPPARGRSKPPWLVSLLVHLALLVLLGLWTMARVPRDEPILTATLDDPIDDILEQVREVAVEAADADESSGEDIPAEPEPLLLAEVAVADLPPVETARSPLFADSSFDPMLAVAAPAGGHGEKAGRGSQGTATFFGTEASGDRFVFLVDNSNSMGGGRLETALMELVASVGSMSAKQSFYVIFYSDMAYRMFHPEPAAEFVPATKENKVRLRQWLTTVEMCRGGPGGMLIDAMEIAIRLQPQVVYLFSDGDTKHQKTLRYLHEPPSRPFIMHTIGMMVADETAAGNLSAAAQAYRGTFRPVGIAPLAREMARRQPIKKNRSPGPVWGLHVPVQLRP